MKELNEQENKRFYFLTRLDGTQGYTLTDSDLWGLWSALEYGLMSGYFKDNREWAGGMVARIEKLRGME